MQESFVGFTYNQIHSSYFHLIRTTNGRVTMPLFGKTRDDIVERPNTDGQYFFASIKTSRIFSVDLTFTNLSNSVYQMMRNFYNMKGLHALIFDEEPYKVYMAKITGTANQKYLNVNDTLNGELHLEFTSYYEYALSRFNYLDNYISLNIDEWQSDMSNHGGIVNDVINVNSGWLLDDTVNSGLYITGALTDFNNRAEWDTASEFITTPQTVENTLPLVNYGDNKASWIFYLKKDALCNGGIQIQNTDTLEEQTILILDNVTCVNPGLLTDTWIEFNSRTQMAYGCDNLKRRLGTVYNGCIFLLSAISRGSYRFKIPQNWFGSDISTFQYATEYL